MKACSRRSLLCGLAATLAAPHVARAAWRQGGPLNFWDTDSFSNCVMFGNSGTGQFGSALPGQSIVTYPFGWRTWITVDVKPFGIPKGATEIITGGIGIVTGAADLFIAYRANASSPVQDWTWYQQQLLSAEAAGGARTVFADAIPLNDDGTFQFTANAKNYPDNGNDLMPGDANAVGWNFKIKAWS